MSLSEKVCGPCNYFTPRLSEEDIARLSQQTLGWSVLPDGKICRVWKFKTYAQALTFVNQVAVIAEQENHHPDIEFGWAYVTLKCTTHAIKGLSENDFILAAKINQIQLDQRPVATL